jgi:hypothetical protein
MRAESRLSADLFGEKPSGRPYVIDPATAESEILRILTPYRATGVSITSTKKPAPNKIKAVDKPMPTTKPEVAPKLEPPPHEFKNTYTPEFIPPEPDDDPGEFNYHSARAKTEHFKAMQAELDYQKTCGELVERETVKRVLFGAGRIARDSLAQIPSRLAAQLAAEKDQHVIQLTLTTEINQILQDLADALSRSTADH